MTITILLHTLSILNPKANLHKTFSMQYIHISIFNSLSHSLWESEATTLHILCSLHYEQGLKVVITLNWGTKLIKIKLVKNIYVSQNYSAKFSNKGLSLICGGGGKQICGGMNMNGPHRFTCLNTWSQVSGTSRRMRSCDLWGGVCHWGLALRFQRTWIIPSVVYLLLALRCCFGYLLPPTLPSWTLILKFKPKRSISFICYCSHGLLSQQ